MNTFGEYFSFTSFGESHGRAIGGVLDGVPAGIRIDMQAIKEALDRRAGRYAVQGHEHAGVSSRAKHETDEVEWLSGVVDGVTLGTPIAFIIRNTDHRSADYEWLKHHFRPGHADYTYEAKYGIRDYRGGGRASARETASRVVAGSVAQQLLAARNIRIQAKVIQIGKETNAELFNQVIQQIKQQGDSIGGVVECRIDGLQAGVGEPIFDKLQAHLAFAIMSINACKGFEYGSGFGNVTKTGYEMYASDDQTLVTGGIAGGIADGSPVVFRCVFKPTASTPKMFDHIAADESPKVVGRHDACIAMRAVPIVEAMAALAIINLLNMQENSRK